jgi:hypothetical protein
MIRNKILRKIARRGRSKRNKKKGIGTHGLESRHSSKSTNDNTPIFLLFPKYIKCDELSVFGDQPASVSSLLVFSPPSRTISGWKGVTSFVLYLLYRAMNTVPRGDS